MRLKLLKDIVIPAGTVFSQAPISTTRSRDHVSAIIGLSKNTSGELVYGTSAEELTELTGWFEVVEGGARNAR